MQETDNHNLNTYSSDETGWTHSPDMEHIEERLVVRDTETNRTNYTAHQDALFIATDTGAVYDGDGTSWNKADRSFSGLTADGMSLEGHNVVDLSNEGYDGTGTKPLNDVWNIYGGNTVYILPEGTYRLENQITGSSFDYVKFIGSPKATIDVVDNETTYAGTGTCFRFTDVESVELRNIDVDITGTAPSGLDIDRGLMTTFFNDYCVVENVSLIGTRHRLQEDGTGTWQRVGDRETFKVIPNNYDSVAYVRNLTMMDGGTYESANTITSGETSGHAIGVAGGAGGEGSSIFEGCSVGSFVDNGFYVKNKDNRVTLRNCYGENCGNSTIRVTNNDRVENCEIRIWDSDVAGEGLDNSMGAVNPFFIDVGDSTVVDGLKLEIDLRNDSTNYPNATTNDIIRVASLSSDTGPVESPVIRNVDYDGNSGSQVTIEGPSDNVVLEGWDVKDTRVGSLADAFMNLGEHGEAGDPDSPKVTLRDMDMFSEDRRCVQVSGMNAVFDNCRIAGGSSPGGVGPDNNVDIYIGDPLNAVQTMEEIRIKDCQLLGNYALFTQSDVTVDNFQIKGTRFPNLSTSDPFHTNNGTVNNWHVHGNLDWNPTFATDYYDIQKNGTDGTGIINYKTN